ncbi:MAG TPA: 4-hydroxy-tetrahydrodipicolinate synthase [Lentisphaeria bacterium]|nr:MAG: 4-hydroxy-tetrahydrodipicolinate synthase [Lentisphaerae bacterium GWF2_49_21]HBC85504.1 4-hydroxy-tetrahydrodipicolinate synthase [Lentisphaeria bacterium]
MELKGVYTAIVTPFSGGKVDFKKLSRLVEIQIKAGVDGIVPVGTTGESPTLSYEEHIKVIEKVIDAADGRCRIIAGTGANSTDEALYLTREAKKAGADATLQVTPYYNKPTPEGLYRHFSTIADKCGLPVVLYNVPGRCGVAIPVETIVRLSKNKNIVAVKEAGGSVERVSAILDACNITVLSGDDSLTIPMMAVGAKGIISVVSNLIPGELKEMVDAFASGDTIRAMKLHMRYFPLFRDMFVEANPIPIKTAMAIKGMIKEEFRLPMCPISAKNREVVIAAMKKSGI